MLIRGGRAHTVNILIVGMTFFLVVWPGLIRLIFAMMNLGEFSVVPGYVDLIAGPWKWIAGLIIAGPNGVNMIQTWKGKAEAPDYIAVAPTTHGGREAEEHHMIPRAREDH